MPLFDQDHSLLLELAKIKQPTKSYRLDYTFAQIDESLSTHDEWDEALDGPMPSEESIDATPHFWYTQYWANCAKLGISADLDGHEFREICDYTFEDDESLYTGHPLDRY